MKKYQPVCDEPRYATQWRAQKIPAGLVVLQRNVSMQKWEKLVALKSLFRWIGVSFPSSNTVIN